MGGTAEMAEIQDCSVQDNYQRMDEFVPVEEIRSFWELESSQTFEHIMSDIAAVTDCQSGFNNGSATATVESLGNAALFSGNNLAAHFEAWACDVRQSASSMLLDLKNHIEDSLIRLADILVKTLEPPPSPRKEKGCSFYDRLDVKDRQDFIEKLMVKSEGDLDEMRVSPDITRGEKQAVTEIWMQKKRARLEVIGSTQPVLWDQPLPCDGSLCSLRRQ
jgi:hypothetical protein